MFSIVLNLSNATKENNNMKVKKNIEKILA